MSKYGCQVFDKYRNHAIIETQKQRQIEREREQAREESREVKG
jgi:hypothetical protein